MSIAVSVAPAPQCTQPIDTFKRLFTFAFFSALIQFGGKEKTSGMLIDYLFYFIYILPQGAEGKIQYLRHVRMCSHLLADILGVFGF